MANLKNSKLDQDEKSLISLGGYVYYEKELIWKLDKNVTLNMNSALKLLDFNLQQSYIKTLAYFATNLSSAYTSIIHANFIHMLKTTGKTIVDESGLINYRSSLSANNECYLGSIRAFLKKWFDLGYYGVTEDVISLLYSWSIKGSIKGDVVKRLDPMQGPLSDIELQGFNEGIVQAYEKNEISISDLALGLVVSNTGRRPIQISHLKIKDVLCGKNKKNEDFYLINVPRGKQRGNKFRGTFNQFAITHELWVVLNAQATLVKKIISQILKFNLQEIDQLELPLFPDMEAIQEVSSIQILREQLQSDRLHISRVEVTNQIKHCAEVAKVRSERTGKLLNVTSYRFRYTVGTRAAREGFGPMVIAELLDHSDNQNAGIYIQNVPEHVEKIDQALGHQLGRYAQAFAGVLVDSEKNACRGNDINSRVKFKGEGTGTCGNFGFCGANVPIPCYTCIHFQPWLNGPHQSVYDELINERARVFNVTGDIQIAAINDRSILAVANVIKQCKIQMKRIKNG
jgi:integrase